VVTVSGTVTVDGKPLTVGWITFYPDETKGNTSAHLPFAEIQKDGTYALSTNGNPGAPPGCYKVVVAATHDVIPIKPRFTSDGKALSPKWLVHEKYTSPATTDLRIEIVERPGAGNYDLRLIR
jgi:hypothetical protein